MVKEYKVSLLEIETALDLVDNNKMLSTYYASKPNVSLDLVEGALEFLNNKYETDLDEIEETDLEGSDNLEDSDEIDIDLGEEDDLEDDDLEDSDDIAIDLGEEEDDLEEDDLEEDDIEENEDDIDIYLEDEDGLEDSDDIDTDLEEEDEINIDLEEDDLEEDDLGDSDSVNIDLGEEDDEIDIDLEEDEDDLEDSNDIDVTLEDDLEDSDEIDIDLEDAIDNNEEDEDDEIDIDLEDDDSEDTVDIELDNEEDELEDDIDIDLEEDDLDNGEDIDISLEEEDEIDVDIEEDKVILSDSKKNEVIEDSLENESKNALERVKEVNTSNSQPIESKDSKVVYTENTSKNVDPVSSTINVKQLNLNNDKLNVASVTGDVNRVNNINQVVSVKKRNYDSLSTDKLYNFVALYMKKHGVKDSGVSKALLTEEFGANNIKKLINKSYLIQLYDGTLTFNR